MPLEHIKKRLAAVRGSLVNLPLHFMEEENVSLHAIGFCAIFGK